VERLKVKALSSSPSTAKKEKERKEKESLAKTLPREENFPMRERDPKKDELKEPKRKRDHSGNKRKI
jgi:hypothetical protein